MLSGHSACVFNSKFKTVLIATDDLVLCAVIHKHTSHVLHKGDEKYV